MLACVQINVIWRKTVLPTTTVDGVASVVSVHSADVLRGGLSVVRVTREREEDHFC